MASITLTAAQVQAQIDELMAKLTASKLVGDSFTAADLRLLLVDSLQKLDTLLSVSPDDAVPTVPDANAGETKTSNVGLNAGGLQPKTKEKLKEWLKEYDGGVKSHGEPNTWDVTLVTDMSNLFEYSNFNAPIDQWNTSEVTNMSCMFDGASSFNQPITMGIRRK